MREICSIPIRSGAEMKPSEVFKKAAEATVRYGNAKHTRQRSRDGAMCMMGAIAFSATGNPYASWWAGAGECQSFLQLATDGGLAGWNDRDDVTEADVIAALDAAYVMALQAEGLEPEDVL